MKTQVISLDAEDDVVSILDRLLWSKAHRLILVWPKSGNVHVDLVNLVLIQRKAEKLGSQIAFVSDDSQFIPLADELGIPVFSSVKAAQRKAWRRPKKGVRTFQRQMQTRGSVDLHQKISPTKIELKNNIRYLIFGISLLAVLTLFAFLIPSASIEIQPETQQQSLTMSFYANSEIKEPTINGALPVKIIEVIVESQQAQGTSGTISYPDQYAAGTIGIKNLTDKKVVVPAGTIVMTLTDPAIKFATSRDLNIDSGSENEKEVQIVATAPGATGNVGSGTIVAVEGSIGGLISVSNLSPTTGGSDVETLSPSTADLAQIKAEISKTMEVLASEELQNTYGEDYFLVQGSLNCEKIIDEKIEPPVGDPGDVVKITQRSSYSIWAIDRNQMKEIVQANLDASLPDGYIGNEGPINIIQSEAPIRRSDGSYAWQVMANRDISFNIVPEKINQSILGLKVNTAVAVLEEEYLLKSPPIIKVTPSFWKRLPLLSFRIDVEIR